MTLYVKPISALLTHDTEMFSNMDPYVVVKIGREKKKTSTHKEGGKKPKWNEVFTFHPNSSDQMEVTVYDQDTFTDDLVGSTRVILTNYMDGQQKKQYFSLTYKGKSAGKIYMSIRYMNTQSSSNNSFQTQPKGWGLPPQNHSAWGQNNNSWGQPPINPQSGWGVSNNNNNGWSQPVQGGWGQPPQPQGAGWGQKQPAQTYNDWANNGWGNTQPSNNNSGWGNNNNGWGNNNGMPNPQQQNQQNNNTGWGNTPSQPSRQDDWAAPPKSDNKNNGWGEAPPQAPQPDLIGLLANVLNNNTGNKPQQNNNNSGWGPNNNGWGNANNNGW